MGKSVSWQFVIDKSNPHCLFPKTKQNNSKKLNWINNLPFFQFVLEGYYQITIFGWSQWSVAVWIIVRRSGILNRMVDIEIVSLETHDQMMSFSNKRATRDQYILYKHSLQLYKVFIFEDPINDWITLNFTDKQQANKCFMH